jgi:hypothetical protein
MKISMRAMGHVWRAWALIALLVWLCAACNGKRPEERLHGTWRADLSPGQAHATLTLKPDGAATVTFTSPQGSSTVEGTFKLSPVPDDELAFSLEGVFAGQAKTLNAKLLNGGESLSLGGLLPDQPAVTLARQP